jgi:3-oxoacyl-[acyl-carrier protein] reductase
MDRQVTLISGARKGIGESLVKHYADQGHIVIGFSRSLIEWKYKNFYAFQGDITDESFIVKLIKEIRSTHGRLDNLINNAGIASMNHSLLTPLATAKKIIDTNFLGTFLLCREAAKLMKVKNFGRIVNLSTVAVPMQLEGEAIYAASKAAVISLTSILAKEFSPFGVTVNCLGPTPIDTDLIKNIPQDKLVQLIDRQAIKRIGTFDDIKNVIDFFISKESHFITGQQLFLGGVS